MSKQRYPEEYKTEAFMQITERGHKVADLSVRLGVSQHSLYQWIKTYTSPASDRQAQMSQADELRKLKSDVNDAQWLQRLHSCGLLRPSFRPARDIAALRAYLRLRERHVDYASAHSTWISMGN